MSDRVTLLLALHCHQPVGNFGWVIRAAFDRAYRPLLERLEDHPSIRVALHYTGCLLDWLEAEEPKFLERVARLVRRGQVEMIGGGYYEPILPLIPEWDRQGQLQLMSEKLVRLFGERPSGAWLAERVWEPHVAGTLARAGFDYTIVDDSHIRAAHGWSPTLKAQPDVFGMYLTDDEGWSLRLFPSSKRLRYWIPFHPVQETIAFLRSCAPGTVVTFADDGEKFGLWPGTYHWVYEEGWLEQWLTAIETNAAWLTTASFRECATTLPAAGQVYLPCTSYEEMVEWSGGNFRNFLVKYPEANWMYKRMLSLSRRCQEARAVAAARNGSRPRAQRQILREAHAELYRAQCNCAYWHGVFGGLYLHHLREGVFRHLLRAEELVERCEERLSRRPTASVAFADVNGDGQLEVRLATSHLQLMIAPEQGGAIIEYDVRRLHRNLGNTLMRQPESYHATLNRAKATLVERLMGEGEHPKSIHDILGVKEAGLESLLIYDRTPRWSALEHLLAAPPRLEQLVQNDIVDLAQPLQPYRVQSSPLHEGRGPRLTAERVVGFQSETGQPHVLHLRKSYQMASSRMQWTYALVVRQVEHAPWAGWIGVEWNVSLRDPQYLEPRLLSGYQRLVVEDRDQGLRLIMSTDEPLDCLCFPIETASGSEEGLERTYQGLCIWWGKQIRRDAEQLWTLTLQHTIEVIAPQR